VQKIIRLDFGVTNDILVTCAECSWRAGPAISRSEANRLGKAHRQSIHPNQAASRQVRTLRAVRA